jgi:CheY-like chemotaxis protein
MARPTVLLVEDRDSIRDHLSLHFQQGGARVLSAANAKDAYRLYRHRAFEISALVTDIRLVNESDHDLSGIELAKSIAEVDPDLPLYGVTAFDPEVGQSVLHQVLKKTLVSSQDPMSIYQHIPSIIENASRYDDSRFNGVPESLVSLKEKYQISAEDFERLISSWRVADLGRVAFLTWHDTQADPSGSGEERSVGERERGIQFVPKGTKVGEEGIVGCDVAVVTRVVAGGAIAELYGMPLIYAYADEAKEAVASLLEHLFECYETMGNPEDFSTSNLLDVVRFRTFLNKLFDPAEGHAE